MKRLLTAWVMLLLFNLARAQKCEGPGQTPSRAFPVCGTSTFQQQTVPLCVTQALPVPGCTNGLYEDRNPYWYKFTCYQSGTLGFLIEPLDKNDDYDWQLYDITGRNPDDVFTDASLIVTGNWAGTYGNTGASSSGVSFIQCGSDPAENKNTFSTMPQLKAGHTYLLLVSHFTNTQSGYKLSFGGGTAVITDTKIPALQAIEASCRGDELRLKLNKKIKCSSLASNGSDFYITPAGSIASVTGVGCSLNFDTDSIVIKLNAPLPPGNYQLRIKKGTDGNTLLDYCDNAASEADAIAFTVLPLVPTPIDSLAAVSCAPKELTLVFKKPIDCKSIASDGSDFELNGSYAVSIAGARGNCSSNGTTKEVIITLAQPLTVKGDFQLRLKRGRDGDAILDECAQETPPGSFVTFSVNDTVNADFTYTIDYACTEDVVHFFHKGGNGINSWRWILDEQQTSNLQNPVARYTNFQQKKNIELIVSNGFCSDTAKQQLVLENYLKADFTVVQDNCPKEPIQFTSTAVGKITSHHWSFGDGMQSTETSPKHTYQEPPRETVYQVQYTVTDSYGCQQSITKPVKIYSSCTIYIPNAFTPNNDGLNDWFKVLNAVKAEHAIFRIYNRWGQLLFETKNWKQGWDGRYKGQLQPGGAYIYSLRYVDSRTGKTVERKGSFVLVR